MKKEYVNLGKVIDREHGVYKNRTNGIYQYILESNTYIYNLNLEGLTVSVQRTESKLTKPTKNE